MQLSLSKPPQLVFFDGQNIAICEASTGSSSVILTSIDTVAIDLANQSQNAVIDVTTSTAPSDWSSSIARAAREYCWDNNLTVPDHTVLYAESFTN